MEHARGGVAMVRADPRRYSTRRDEGCVDRLRARKRSTESRTSSPGPAPVDPVDVQHQTRDPRVVGGMFQPAH